MHWCVHAHLNHLPPPSPMKKLCMELCRMYSLCLHFPTMTCIYLLKHNCIHNKGTNIRHCNLLINHWFNATSESWIVFFCFPHLKFSYRVDYCLTFKSRSMSSKYSACFCHWVVCSVYLVKCFWGFFWYIASHSFSAGNQARTLLLKFFSELGISNWFSHCCAVLNVYVSLHCLW